ncbi:MAG: hypothetical protein IPL39_21385 [Opitutaceae bacterium]|nr:hypothetical protein [Opitutaceae bacterium]
MNLAVLVYLRWDPEQHSPLPYLGQQRDEADPRWDTLAWMMDKHPKSRIGEARLRPDAAMAIRLPTERSAWPEHVRTHRQAILDAWEADALGREWIETISRRPPVGVHVYRYEEPILSFRQTRASLFARTAYAFLLADEGRRDEAIRLVLPELVAWQNLQRCEAMLVHQMIAMVMIKESMKTIDAILDLGAIDPATRATLRETLEKACPIGEVFRFGFLGDYWYSRSFDAVLDRGMTVEESKLFFGTVGLDSGPIVFVGRRWGLSLLVQQQSWRAEYLGALSRFTALATARDLTTLAREESGAERRWAIKNALGVRLIGVGLPAFTKVVNYVWTEEDARLALLRRVGTPDGASD